MSKRRGHATTMREHRTDTGRDGRHRRGRSRTRNSLSLRGARLPSRRELEAMRREDERRQPEHGHLVVARIKDAVEARRFVKTNEGSVLVSEQGVGAVEKPKRTWADDDDVVMLGVEITCMTTAESRKQRQRERVRVRQGRARSFER